MNLPFQFRGVRIKEAAFMSFPTIHTSYTKNHASSQSRQGWCVPGQDPGILSRSTCLLVSVLPRFRFHLRGFFQVRIHRMPKILLSSIDFLFSNLDGYIFDVRLDFLWFRLFEFQFLLVGPKSHFRLRVSRLS